MIVDSDVDTVIATCVHSAGNPAPASDTVWAAAFILSKVTAVLAAVVPCLR